MVQGLESKLLKGGYMGVYVREYDRGILGVWATAPLTSGLGVPGCYQDPYTLTVAKDT